MAIIETPCVIAGTFIFCNVVERVGRSSLSEHFSFVTKLKIYRLDEECQKGNTWFFIKLARPHTLLNRGILSGRNCSNTLLIWASTEIQCPIALFRYHRLFARTRVTGKDLLSVVRNNHCTVLLSRGLRLSAHKGLVLDTLVHWYQRRLVMSFQIDL